MIILQPPGTTYYYWVKAATSSSGANASNLSSSYDSGYRANNPTPQPPSGVSATKTYTDRIAVSWYASSGASYYQVYRGTSSSSSYATALSSWITSTSYDDYSANAGTTYYYWVKAATSSSGSNPSGFSSYDSGYRQPVIIDDHSNSCNSATSVGVTSGYTATMNGNLETVGDWDYFRLDVPSSGMLTVYSTGSTDTYGYLKNSSCTDLTSSDDSTDTNFRISYNVGAAGTYYIAVKYWNSSGTGTYTLNVQFVSNGNIYAGNWNVPYLCQLNYQNIGESACGPTSVAMLLRFYFPNSGIDMPEVYHSGTQNI